MATGMVLIIVSRNIDLSVGSLLGFLGYTMAMVQTQWIPNALHLGFDQPYTWLVALAVGLVLGALIGAFQGIIIAYGGVPSFIVTLGGFLVWRGLIFPYAQGQTSRRWTAPLRCSAAAQRLARRVGQLDRRHRRAASASSSRPSSIAAGASAYGFAVRPDVGAGDGARRSAAASCSARSGSPTATCGRLRWRTSTRARTASRSRRAGCKSRRASPIRC